MSKLVLLKSYYIWNNFTYDQSSDLIIIIERDLGMLFSTDLKFNHHIAAAANKANRVVGSFWSKEKQMFMQLFKFLVSGHLKYAKTVWWGAICLMFFGQNVPKPLSEHDTSTDITPVHVVNKPNETSDGCA